MGKSWLRLSRQVFRLRVDLCGLEFKVCSVSFCNPQGREERSIWPGSMDEGAGVSFQIPDAAGNSRPRCEEKGGDVRYLSTREMSRFSGKAMAGK